MCGLKSTLFLGKSGKCSGFVNLFDTSWFHGQFGGITLSNSVVFTDIYYRNCKFRLFKFIRMKKLHSGLNNTDYVLRLVFVSFGSNLLLALCNQSNICALLIVYEHTIWCSLKRFTCVFKRILCPGSFQNSNYFNLKRVRNQFGLFIWIEYATWKWKLGHYVTFII